MVRERRKMPPSSNGLFCWLSWSHPDLCSSCTPFLTATLELGLSMTCRDHHLLQFALGSENIRVQNRPRNLC
ncbi:hypothetical protein IE53DRAFT_260826 [Violaceomyces palustris]|uniref:Uncharacterized protein n=1 Tax=Violaceomyces palustris TaxID=1673888 RepID=A0ACD0NN48_9BASI|nr:hypothetical protein IE53DRAFT_260826 [Violaceomyces palustris]